MYSRPSRIVCRVELEDPDRHRDDARAVRDRPRHRGGERGVVGRDPAGRRARAEARRRRSRATTSRRSRHSRTPRRRRLRSATTRSPSRRSWRGCRPREFAARAAIDGALHDLQGKLVGRPVYQLLGLARVWGRRRRGRSGSATRTTWLAVPEAGRRPLQAGKLKIGGGDGLDVDRVRAVREVQRRAAPGRCERSLERWTKRSTRCRSSRSSASHTASSRSRLGIPRGADREGALADPDLRRRGLSHAARTWPRCAERAHGINVKLAKSGGIREAVRMVHAARALESRLHARLHDRI